MNNGVLGELMAPTGLALLDSLPPYDDSRALQVNAELRKAGVAPELAAALLTQSRLRVKARVKFGAQADRMLFTAPGVEQATRPMVAAHHAQRYVAAGRSRVIDLTCGIGADSLGFAATGLSVLACEIDPETTEIARFNLRDQTNVEVRCGDGLVLAKAEAREGDGLFADPARRDSVNRGKRQQIFDPEQYLPPLTEILALRAVTRALGVKISPVIPHRIVPAEAEAQWVSVDGDVVECGLWFGPLAPRGPGFTALLIKSTGTGSGIFREVTPDGIAKPELGQLGTYIFEPDGAIIRAGLLGTAANELYAHQFDPDIAYLSGDVLPANSEVPIASLFEIKEIMPFSIKQLKAYLRALNVGRVTIKKRGTAVTPEQLRPQLALKGDNEATIILTRVKGKQSALIVDPIPL